MGALDEFAELAGGFPEEVGTQALAVARIVASVHPELAMSVKPGWKSLNFSHPRAGYVCGVFLQRRRAVLIFEHGRLLSDPDGLLEGETSQVRQIPFPPGRDIPAETIGHYISEAIAIAS